MIVWRWLGIAVCLLGLTVLVGGNISATAQDKDKDKDKKTENKKDDTKKEAKKDETKKDETKKKEEPKKDETKKKEEVKDEPGKTRFVWKAFDPKSEWFQELVTSTTQDMKVMGQEISQKQNQTFYLKWTAGEKTKDGNYDVTQEIVGLKMKITIGGNTIEFNSADEKQPANPMTDFFKALLQLKLKMTISPKMEVVNIDGQEAFIKSLGATNPQMEPLLKNILSKEALQQMAEPTWGALPDHPVKKGESWGNSNKPNVLNLGPIGTYTTTFTYTYDGVDEKTKLEKISIKSDLKYAKPVDKAGLPFTIKDANLTSKDGSGYALFDPAKGRFAETKMTMKLEGDLTIEVGGMETKVSLTQTQEATSTTMDKAPAFLKVPQEKTK